MTVRTWFVISALAVAALAAAFGLRFFTPVPTPEIVVRVGEVRISGELVEACWPQRGGAIRCEQQEDEPDPAEIGARGQIRAVVLFPAQPEEGSIRVTDRQGRTVLEEDWPGGDYDFDPGIYTLETHAAYPEGAEIRYAFRLTVN